MNNCDYTASKLVQPHDLQFTSCFSQSTSFALADESESAVSVTFTIAVGGCVYVGINMSGCGE